MPGFAHAHARAPAHADLDLDLDADADADPDGATRGLSEPCAFPRPVCDAPGRPLRHAAGGAGPGSCHPHRGFDVATGELRFTEALIYYDEEANKAAREDGRPGGAPNPVWIRDLATTGSLRIDPDATVSLMGWDATGDIVRKQATAEFLVGLLTGATPSGWYPPLYVFIVVEDGRITGIDEPQLP